MNTSSDITPRPDAATRILHTSDWHLGVTVRNESRHTDHDAVVDEIVAIAARAQPDLIVHTGDLFHGGRPGMADFGRAIRALRALGDIAPVVVLAGNHDSAIALETLGTAVSDPVPELAAEGRYDPNAPSPARIRVVARAANASNGGVATYPTAAGGKLRFTGLPFVHQNRIVGDWADILAQHATYTDGIRKICDLLANSAFESFDTANDVAVFASHIHVDGARTSSEREVHVSDAYATDPAHLEARYGYLAFGHIHIPQAIADGRGRYAGSIIQVDFGEAGETKQVVVADLTPGRPTRIHDVELSAGRRLRRVSSPIGSLAKLSDDLGDAIVEVTVTAEPDSTAVVFNPNAELGEHDSLSSAVAAALPDATIVGVIDARRPRSDTADQIEIPENTETVSEMFRGWLHDSGGPLFERHATTGAASGERVAELFDEIHHAVGTDTDIAIAELEQMRALDAELGN
ncbi:metallophosphoesterase family protein [Ilumatobacter coccineus]|nr:exonuclease SbcCD subunit D [Ilumatobacter coccineus]